MNETLLEALDVRCLELERDLERERHTVKTLLEYIDEVKTQHRTQLTRMQRLRKLNDERNVARNQELATFRKVWSTKGCTVGNHWDEDPPTVGEIALIVHNTQRLVAWGVSRAGREGLDLDESVLGYQKRWAEFYERLRDEVSVQADAARLLAEKDQEEIVSMWNLFLAMLLAQIGLPVPGRKEGVSSENRMTAVMNRIKEILAENKSLKEQLTPLE